MELGGGNPYLGGDLNTHESPQNYLSMKNQEKLGSEAELSYPIFM